MASQKHQPWYKRVLITFWIIQLGFMLWLICSTSILTTVTRGTLLVAEIVLLIICAICVLLNVIEIILFIPGKLGPLTYLTSQVVKTTIWLILFVIGIVDVGESAARHLRGTNSTVAIIEIVVILLSFVATLIYASTVYHRARHGRNNRSYTPAAEEDGIAPFTLRSAIAPTPAPVAYGELGRELGHGHETAFEMGPGENVTVGGGRGKR